MLKILLFGKRGQLGSALSPLLQAIGDVTQISRQVLDLSDRAALEKVLQSIRPNWIVNAAAYTAVDRAEYEPELAYAINAHAVAQMAEYAERAGAWLVHYSTDYVFDGQQTQAFQETDAPRPLSVYGGSKWAGEQAIMQSGCHYLILRTSWLCSAEGQHFARTLLRLALQRNQLNVVTDQSGAPTSAHWLAEATLQLIRHVSQVNDAIPSTSRSTSLSGIYHLTAAGRVSWFTYAQYLLQAAQQAGLPLRVRAEQIVPVTSTAYAQMMSPQQLATRPANSCLATTKVERVFNLPCTSWQAQIAPLLPKWFALANDDLHRV